MCAGIPETIMYAIICKTGATRISIRIQIRMHICVCAFAQRFVGGLPDRVRQMQNQQITYIRLTYYDIHMYVCILPMCVRADRMFPNDNDDGG